MKSETQTFGSTFRDPTRLACRTARSRPRVVTSRSYQPRARALHTLPHDAAPPRWLIGQY